MRGEQTLRAWRCFSRRGSPPLARGTAIYTALPPATRRITPACAGNSYNPFCCFTFHWDHPRLRGEQEGQAARAERGVGSPPLARGTGKNGDFSVACHRITPACAGNSIRGCSQNPAGGDHPRLRGEQQSRGLSMPQSRGSPPLARGTASSRRASDTRSRITPACAGNRR